MQSNPNTFVGLYFLYFLLFILAPLGYGAALAVLLKELHLRQMGKTDQNDPEVSVVNEEPAPEEPEEPEEAPTPPEEPSTTEQPPTELSSTELPSTELPSKMADEEGPVAAEEEAPEGSAPKSVFDDMGLLPKSFKVDDVLDGMLGEQGPETTEDPNFHMETADDGESPQDELFDEENDLLARAMEFSGVDKSDPIDFSSEFENGDRDSEAISSTARELLGDEFDFNALMPPEAPPETPVRELGDGVFQSETMSCTALESDRLVVKEEVASVFPDEMVANTTIAPDQSEAARQNSFVEELRPMFVRQRKS